MPQDFKPSYTFTEDRLNELKQLFPEAFEDGVFNVDTLKELIGEYTTSNKIKEHFGLNWMGKQDARKIASKPPTGTLKPCPGEGVNEDTTENIFIEGENLEVLKILRKSYIGKIKMIYIDPPYNTGNDFIYNDTFADSTEDYLRKTGEKSDEGLLVSNPKSSGKYHANWLSFMYPRLRVAKDLLKEDGLIMVSIDDNEAVNLKQMLDEVFGNENFIETVIWKKRYGGGAKEKYLVALHEYVYIYAKNINEVDNITVPLTEESIKRYYKLKDNNFNLRGAYRTHPLEATKSMGERKNLVYGIPGPNGVEIMPKRQWLWGKERALKALEKGELEFIKSKDGNWSVHSKQYLYNEKGKIREGKQFSIIDNVYTQHGTNEIIDLFGNAQIFSFPKPTKFIQTLINLCAKNKNDIVLDFFAGSGSTAHAIIDLVKTDNLSRKFITVQLPEICNEKEEAFKHGYKNIAQVTKERIRRVINKIDKTQGFKVFKQENSTIYKWQDFVPDQDGILPDLFNNLEMAYKNPLQDGVTTQDFITEVILQEGFPLTAKQEEVASGIFKISHEWIPYTLYITMLYSFKDTDFNKLQLQETDHFVCLDKAFEGNDALKQELDNQCKIFTI